MYQLPTQSQCMCTFPHCSHSPRLREEGIVAAHKRLHGQKLVVIVKGDSCTNSTHMHILFYYHPNTVQVLALEVMGYWCALRTRCIN